MLGWDEQTLQRLVTIYGRNSEAIVKRACQGESLRVQLDERLPRSFASEVAHAVETEMAFTVDDLLFRRTMLGFDPKICQVANRALEALPIGLKVFAREFL